VNYAAKRQRGSSLVELMAASMVVLVGIGGLVSAWTYGMRQSNEAKRVLMAGEIATSEIERSKAVGWAGLPIGSYSSTTGTAVANGPTKSFDRNGIATTLGSSSEILRSVVTYTDHYVARAADATSYKLTYDSLRVIRVRVFDVESNTVIADMSTVAGKGGL
jgi:Tfp pilus assembly protein PilV